MCLNNPKIPAQQKKKQILINSCSATKEMVVKSVFKGPINPITKSKKKMVVKGLGFSLWW
jgi:hypothetical protein